MKKKPTKQTKPKTVHVFTICRAQHAPLYGRFDLDKGKHMKLEGYAGNAPGPYGPIEVASGAEYKCLGEGNHGNKVAYSSDLHPGLFYSETVFVWGHEGERGESLPHEVTEAFVRRFYGAKTNRVLLPRGYERGGAWTWDRACMYCPPETQPYWEEGSMRRRLEQQFPGCEILSERTHAVEVLIEQ